MANSCIYDGMYEPLPRYRHCGTLVKDKLIIYGGSCIYNTLASNQVIEIFDINTEKWKQEETYGVPPEAVLSLACTSIGSIMYTFGGFSGHKYYNTLHKLDVSSNTWMQLSTSGEEPMPKESAVMINYKEKYLVTFGGYGPSPTSRQDNVAYTEHPHIYYLVWTNELVCYEIDSGMHTHVYGHCFIVYLCILNFRCLDSASNVR